MLDQSWDNESFGGNSGLRDARVDDQICVIMNVECNGLTEAEIENILKSSLALKKDSKIEFFKRRNRSGVIEFTGTIKVIFKDTAIRDKIKIGPNQRYSVSIDK